MTVTITFEGKSLDGNKLHEALCIVCHGVDGALTVDEVYEALSTVENITIINTQEPT
jgi:cytochrome c